MTTAIIGGGEVGLAYATGLVEQAATGPGPAGEMVVAVCAPRPSPAATALAARHTGAAVHREPGPWLQQVDQVWLAVTGDIVLAVLDGLLPWLPPAVLVVDLTTANPADKREADVRATQAGARYVDAVILGAVALSGARTPLLAAGPHAAEAMAPFVRLGASVTCLPDATSGDAAALKLLRTILTKGLEALAVECLVAAERQGVREELYEAMRDVDATGFTAFLDMLVRTHVVHAERRRDEIDRARAELARLGLPSSMLGAADEVFGRSVSLRARTRPPAAASTDVAVALAWLADTSSEPVPVVAASASPSCCPGRGAAGS